MADDIELRVEFLLHQIQYTTIKEETDSHEHSQIWQDLGMFMLVGKVAAANWQLQLYKEISYITKQVHACAKVAHTTCAGL